jgi:L-2-hydroxyglutarate oxidase LhgO
MTREADVVVVGAGLVGLATAVALLERKPDLRLAVIEKERRLAAHQSSHNSGVLHAGLYYVPGSLKARLCREGRAALIAFADEHGIQYRLCGKLVVAVDESELGRFGDLAARGRANGLAVDELEPREWAPIEPNVRGVRALHIRESGVIDFGAVAAAYAAVLERSGARILLGHEVGAIERDGSGRLIRTSQGDVRAAAVVACAGLYADRVAAMTGDLSDDYRIVPFRGDYYTFRARARELVSGLVYPVPDPSFPFLGVHFTRRIDGELVAGPNAVPALAREGYRRLSLRPRDVLDVIRFPGFRKLARSYAATGAAEIWRDLVKPAAVRQMQRYLPTIDSRDVRLGPSGVRAQVMSRDGSLVDDFLIRESPGALHVVNAPSPGATASLAIGRHIAERAIESFEL